MFSTDICQTAFLTMRLRPRCTDVSSVIYQPVAEITAFFRRDDLPKFHLYFLRFLDSIYQTDPVTESDAMRIVTIAGLPNTSPMIRFALFLPTPGSFNNLLKSSGTFPPYSSRSIRIQALISLALLFPSPHGLTISSISSGVASASALTSGYFAYKPSTTTLTLASVHCAARRTLTSSFHASS